MQPCSPVYMPGVPSTCAMAWTSQGCFNSSQVQPIPCPGCASHLLWIPLLNTPRSYLVPSTQASSVHTPFYTQEALEPKLMLQPLYLIDEEKEDQRGPVPCPWCH